MELLSIAAILLGFLALLLGGGVWIANATAVVGALRQITDVHAPTQSQQRYY